MKLVKLRIALLAALAALSLAVPAVQAQLLMGDDTEKLHDTTPGAKPKYEKGNSEFVNDTPCMTWIDESVPLKGVILCVHGLGLHKGCYRTFGEKMAPKGWAVYAMDVRGFGSFQKMPEVRHLDFHGTIGDVAKTLRFIRAQHPNKPVFLLGESMGGAISVRTTSFYPELIDGLIASVPAGDRWHMMSDSVKVGMNLFLRPGKTMDVAPILMRSTVKEDLRDEWHKDEFARFDLTPMDLIHFQKLCDGNVECARRITKTPVLVVQGEKDMLVKASSTLNVTNEIKSPDTRCIVIANGEHLTFEEAQFETIDGIMDQLLGWLDEHSKAPVTAATSSKGL